MQKRARKHANTEAGTGLIIKGGTYPQYNTKAAAALHFVEDVTQHGIGALGTTRRNREELHTGQTGNNVKVTKRVACDCQTPVDDP